MNMAPETALRLYISIQVSLLLGFALFCAFRRVSLPLSQRARLKILQGMILVCLISPMVAFLPGMKSPQVSMHETEFRVETLGRHVVLQHQQGRSFQPDIAATEPVIAARHSPLSLKLTWNHLIFLFIAINALFTLTRRSREFFKVKQLLKTATPLRSVGRLKILVTDAITVPFSMSFGSASSVVIPTYLFDRPEDFRAVMAHEIQHIRNRDTRAILIFEILGCLFAPALRLWKNTFTELQELSCDEALIGREKVSLHDYASCLVRVAEAALARGSLYVGTACMAADPKNPKAFQSLLLRRISMFVNQKQSSRPFLGALYGISVLIIGSLLAFQAGAKLNPGDLAPVNPGKAAYDPEIQMIAESRLKETLAARKAEAGFAVVAEPKTGRILAVASVEGEAIKEKNHMGALAKDWALTRLIEPASALKTLIYAEGLEKKRFTASDEFDCNKGSYRVGDRVHHDHKKFDHLSAREIVVHSSNIGGIHLAEKLGPIDFSKSLHEWGFGFNGSTQSFPGARAGFLTNMDSTPGSQWLPKTATGYSMIYTNPIEMVQIYSAIANGGTLMKAIPFDSKEPQALRRVFSEETTKSVRETLAEAATIGTGSNRGIGSHYTAAGKTGTTYHPENKFENNKLGGDEAVGHFIGFSPAKDPKITVYVAIYSPHDSLVNGSRHAAPLFKTITEDVLKHLKVAPDKTQ